MSELVRLPYGKNFELKQQRKIFCNRCKNKTNHELVHIEYQDLSDWFEYEWDQSDTTFREVNEYHLWSCLGCKSCVLEIAYTSDAKEDNVGVIWESRYYPKPNNNCIQEKHFLHLEPKLRTLYKHIVESYNNESRLLSTIGLRTLLEGICLDKNVGSKRQQLVTKIPLLKEFLPEPIANRLHVFRYFGNNAAHELVALDE